MASFKAHPAHSNKPSNQGSSGTPKVQAPKKSAKPAKGGEAPTTNQSTRRGVKTNGQGGSPVGRTGPKPFKA